MPRGGEHRAPAHVRDDGRLQPLHPTRATRPGPGSVSDPGSVEASKSTCMPTQIPRTGRLPANRRPISSPPCTDCRAVRQAPNAPTPGTTSPSASSTASRRAVSSVRGTHPLQRAHRRADVAAAVVQNDDLGTHRRSPLSRAARSSSLTCASNRATPVLLGFHPQRAHQVGRAHRAGQDADARQGEGLQQRIGDLSRVPRHRARGPRPVDPPEVRVGASSRASSSGGAVSRSDTRVSPIPRVQTSQRVTARQVDPCSWTASRSASATRDAHGRRLRGTGRPPSRASSSSYGGGAARGSGGHAPGSRPDRARR